VRPFLRGFAGRVLVGRNEKSSGVFDFGRRSMLVVANDRVRKVLDG
jgi:hypothetical protein